MKYIITWNVGYGENYELIDTITAQEAQDIAEEQAREEAESNMSFGAKEFTLQEAENYGFEEQHPDYVEE